ncbi:MAG: hypothetical protein AB7D06_15520 [Pedobacter sp.]
MRTIKKSTKWLPILVLALVSSMTACASGNLAGEEAHVYQLLTLEPYFSCNIPASWGREEGDSSFGLSREEKKVYSITLHESGTGVIPVRISITFYAKGNQLEDSPDTYIRRHARPLFVLKEGDVYGPVTDTYVTGRNAQVFERQKNEFVPYFPLDGIEPPTDDIRVYERRERMARPIPVREKFVVIPVNSGFYALRYSASAEQFEQFLPDFEQVTTTFHVLQ